MSDFNQHRRGGARRDGFASSYNRKNNGRTQESRFTREGQWGDRPSFGTRDGRGNTQGKFRAQGFSSRGGDFRRERDDFSQHTYKRSYGANPSNRYENAETAFSSDPWTPSRNFSAPQRGKTFRPQPQRSGTPNNKRFDKRNNGGGKRRIEYKEEVYDPNQPIRLNKYLANAGVCSRRDADKYIEAGVVKVNGEVITELGHKVLRSDEVLFHDQLIKAEKKIYVLLNKPKGYVTTSEDPQNRKTVMDLVRNACMERIYPVGRLDRNTTGVLLLTNDGEMASKLTHPKFLKKKIYHVYLDRNVTAADLRQIAEGITLEDGDIRADAVDYASETDKKQVGIEIHSGKNRIVRRIFAALGYNVLKLDRVYFAGLTKKNVKRGDWRYLSEEEVRMLRMGSFE